MVLAPPSIVPVMFASLVVPVAVPVSTPFSLVLLLSVGVATTSVSSPPPSALPPSAPTVNL